jgi:hypothetical protein
MFVLCRVRKIIILSSLLARRVFVVKVRVRYQGSHGLRTLWPITDTFVELERYYYDWNRNLPLGAFPTANLRYLFWNFYQE